MVGLAGERALTRAAPGARAARPGPDTAVVLRADDGQLLALDTSRWHREPTPVERRLLGTLPGPVLDVGCGPGRLVVGLARLGCPALGVDTAPAAVHLARRRGASVLQRSVFDPLPGERRWRGILLVDGNIGIGGDPVRLLRRCRELGAPTVRVVAELDQPGRGWCTHRVRLERAQGHSAWFAWAVVGADAIGELAGEAGLDVARVWQDPEERRWFAELRRPAAARPTAGPSPRAAGPGGTGSGRAGGGTDDVD